MATANGRRSDPVSSVAAAHLAPIRAARRVVVKVGSALLVEGGVLRAGWLDALAAELAAMRAGGQDLVVVSSGAIALGAARLGLPQGGRASLADAQAAAAVGQIALAGAWAEALARSELVAAQLLLTLDDLEDRRRYLNASATFGTLLAQGAVPVVNENDSVATEEIRFGDNDRLAARVAQAAGADAVVLLSDVDGLYTADPAAPDAQHVPVVDEVTDTVRAMASPVSGSGLGTGGMLAKLAAAELAGRAGIALAIIDGRPDAPIARALRDCRGTLFTAAGEARAFKGWLGARARLAGTLEVDQGCAVALAGGASLLAAGIRTVEGSFQRGDAVGIVDPAGRRIAQGLVEYDAAELRAIAGLARDRQEQALGYTPRSAVVHRDQLVLL